MRRVVLLALHIEDSPESLALGAASVAAAVAEAHRGLIEVRVVEDFLVRGAGELARRVMGLGPDFLGLSVFTWNRSLELEVAALCREAKKDLVVFAGGPEATADSEGLFSEAMSRGLSLDFIIRGEGESLSASALGLLASAPSLSRPGDRLPESLVQGLRGLQGLALPGEGPWPRAPLEDLSLLPSAFLGGWMAPRQGGLLWELARGCPFRCSYCYEGKGERGLRGFPLTRLEAELERIVESGAKQVFVLDPTFDADKARARLLLDLFARLAPGIHWKLEARAELLDRDLVRRLSRLDCALQIGLQSASDEVCEAVGRPLDRKAFMKGIGLLNEAGIVFGIDLIYGLPADDFQGFSRSLDFALGLQPNHLDVFPLSVLPGTTLADEAATYGLVVQEGAPHALISSPGFPPEAMEKAAGLAAACDLLYCRGRAVSWFLQALRPLKARPSAFLGRFAAFVHGRADLGAAASPLAIEEAQLAFLDAEYRAKGLALLLPALCDIVRFNGAWGRALAEGEATELELSYDPDEVLGPAALDLAAFVRAARPRRGSYVVEPGPEGPRLRKAAGGRRPGPGGITPSRGGGTGPGGRGAR
jgi:hypothetical protein